MLARLVEISTNLAPVGASPTQGQLPDVGAAG